MSGGSASSWSRRRAATSRSIWRRSASSGLPRSGLAGLAGVAGLAGLVEPPLHPGSFVVDDLLELAANVAERVTELVAVQHFLSATFQAVEEIAQPHELATRRVAGSPATLHQATERLDEVALLHHVVGERVEDLVGTQVGDPLRPVPAGVAGARGQGRVGLAGRLGCIAPTPARASRGPASGPRSRGIGRVGGHDGAGPVTGGRPCRPGSGPC